MDVIIALVFFSLTLVIAGLIFFFSRLCEGDFEHGERLSLLPLADDDGAPAGDDETGDDKSTGTVFNRDEETAGLTPPDGGPASVNRPGRDGR